MPQNILTQKNSIMIVVALVVLFGGGYYFISSILGEASSGGSVDKTLFTKDVANFYAVKDKIKLSEKDLAFTKKTFYDNLKDYTVEIPSVKPEGRDNPFVPYAAP